LIAVKSAAKMERAAVSYFTTLAMEMYCRTLHALSPIAQVRLLDKGRTLEEINLDFAMASSSLLLCSLV
jgi:hypothetical protein